jgi:hypothetical protein
MAGVSAMVIVNGYICMNCCDIDKARLDQDPHQATNQVQKQLERRIDRSEPANFGPAVTFGGSLQGSTAGTGTNGTGESAVGQSQAPQNSNVPTSSSTFSVIA